MANPPKYAVATLTTTKVDVTCYLLTLLLVLGLVCLWADNDGASEKLPLDLTDIPQIVLDKNVTQARARNRNCSYWDCFNVYRCGQRMNVSIDGEQERISIYVYPLKEYIDAESRRSAFQLSKEFHTILKTIVNSPYYTANPTNACLFVPTLDTLNQNRIDANLIGKALASLPHWERGENHLLFNFIAGVKPDYNAVLDVNSDRAMILGAGFDTWTYRTGFDLAIPMYSPILESYQPSLQQNRKYILISAQLNILQHQYRILKELIHDYSNDMLLLQRCPRSTNKVKQSLNAVRTMEYVNNSKEIVGGIIDVRCNFPQADEYEYPAVLESGIFCLITRGVRLAQPTLLDALAAGCIPVIMVDNLVLPFNNIIDWELAAIRIYESNLHSLMSTLKSVTRERIWELQQHGRYFYERYFASLTKIVLTALEQLNDRIVPHLSRTYSHWNIQPQQPATQKSLYRMRRLPWQSF